MTRRISVSHLDVRLDGSLILDDVTCSVGSGEFLTVIGPNGAGKSTLLRCIDGILEPSAGTVEIDERLVSSYSRRELARTVSYVPQPDPGSLEHSVRSFVEMGRYPHLRAWAALTGEDRAAVDRAMQLTEIDGLGDRSMASLSGGERQRASIAAALAQGGSILLLDEPTSFLDYRHQVQILDLLDRLHLEHRLTIVAVTHDLNGTVAFSDAVLALKDGAVVLVGGPEALLREDVLAEIFDADFHLVPGGCRGRPLVVPARNGG